MVTQANLTPQVTLTIGFVRDGSGKQISSSPVLIWNDAVTPGPVPLVDVQSFPQYGYAAIRQPTAPSQMSPPHDEIVTVEGTHAATLDWRQRCPAMPAEEPHRPVRADAGVDPKLVERSSRSRCRRDSNG